MQSRLEDIIQKLDSFIRKYYLNSIIRGCIYFASIALAILLAVLLIEYFGEFNSGTRTVLFYGSITALLLVLFIQIIYPLSKYLRIGQIISHEEASDIVGKHFENVSDKLKNLLQLSSKLSSEESELLVASIEQKVSELKPIPFRLAIDLSQNRKYLKYLSIPVAVFFLLYLINPSLISDSSGRLIAHNQEFVPSAPYSLKILNEDLTAFKNEEFKLQINASGKEVPSRVMVIVKGEEYLMKQTAFGDFQHTFKNLQTSFEFYFSDGKFESPMHTLEVLTPPSLIDFEIEASYPKYLNKKSEIFNNTGDLRIAEGTSLKWNIRTEATSEMELLVGDSVYNLIQSAENEYSFQDRFFKSSSYGLVLKNQQINQYDTIFYTLSVIPDLVPQISLNRLNDSLNFERVYFEGIVKDDHGFSGLYFHSRTISKNDSSFRENKIEIPINLQLNQTKYYYAWDIASYELEAGERLEYFFEVWDNDGVNGRKSAKTSISYFKAPSKKEIEKQTKEANEEIKSELKKNIELSQEINRELEKLKEKMLNKKELGYQEKKQLENLLKKQKQLKNSVEKMQSQQKEKNRLDLQFNEQDEAILEKQKQLEDLFEKIMSDEMRELMEEMEKLMQDFQKDKLQQALEEMELNNDQLEKELDRNLELFKQLEVEKELADAKEKLDELKKAQDDLKEKTEERKTNKDELSKEQDKLNKEFEELDKKLDDLAKKNSELEKPNPMEKTQSKEDEIKEDMKKSLEELQKGKNSKASPQQQKSSDGMQKLSESLASMQSQMQSQQAGENLEDLRALLENLITLSFEQEDLMEELKKTERDDPRYVDLAQDQRKLQDDSKIIQDSLFALSKRVMSLEAIVNREISSINYNMKKAIHFMGERSTPLASNRQQLAMTSINNLALILDEAVQQMQSQMQSKGQCDKPGQGNPKPGDGQKPGNLKNLQKQLNQQLESLKKSMEEGKKPGDGKGSGGAKPSMSKEIAQMAAKQAAIRRSLEKMQEQMGESNSGGSGSLKRLGEMMEQTETDLVNKSITNETLLRQQEILSRLLESEKAEREREKEQKRESKEFTQKINRNPNEFLEYNRRKEREIELLQTLPPSFSPFYKGKVTEYFNKIEK